MEDDTMHCIKIQNCQSLDVWLVLCPLIHGGTELHSETNAPELCTTLRLLCFAQNTVLYNVVTEILNCLSTVHLNVIFKVTFQNQLWNAFGIDTVDIEDAAISFKITFNYGLKLIKNTLQPAGDNS